MAEVIIMPKLGFNMNEGKLVQWYKNEGDEIAKGEPLFSIETDKTNMDIEATSDGVVKKLLIEEGDQIPVTLPIAVVGAADEDLLSLQMPKPSWNQAEQLLQRKKRKRRQRLLQKKRNRQQSLRQKAAD